MTIELFRVQIPESTLEDLRRRLGNTRWPDEIPDSDWDYGSNLGYVKELVSYWQNEFDWRAQEEAINRFSHFRTDVDGTGIHFIHEKGKGPDPMPLIITHGWPSTIFEILKIIPMLTDPASHGGDPADSFDVVVPSMPGYGFSDRTTSRGMGPAAISDLWAKLMTEQLGYDRFVAQGGDWGALVTTRLGYDYPDNVRGIHITMVAGVAINPGDPEPSEAERQLIKEREVWQRDEGGYGHIQGTKPQTLGYGLNDSPAGLAAWIVEKFRAWSDCGGDVESRFTKDELLTNITIYWATETINSSTRLYYESRQSPLVLSPANRVEVPTAIAKFPVEISRPPREWAERGYNVQRWTEMPSGGHFAAMEEPELLSEDIRAFFRTLR